MAFISSLSLKMRNAVDTTYDAWYDEALTLAKAARIDEWQPRTVEKQTTRGNPPHDSVSGYYRHLITISLLDHFHSLEAQFDIDNVNVYKRLNIVPAKILTSIRSGIDWK